MNGQDRRLPYDAQRVDTPLTRSAIFLVLEVVDEPTAIETVRSVLSSVADISKNVAFRDLTASFACTVGLGSVVWERVMRTERPRELHPFIPVAGDVHSAVSTPGDLFFHIRADRQDLCFEFERQLLAQFGSAVRVADETVGFRYFDVRDLLGFVDGTANPDGEELADATIVGDEDPGAAGGSYVVTQKYVHDMEAWHALTTEQQEQIMGRSKADNVELGGSTTTQKSHKSLATVKDEDGEHDILRDNMPFGSPAAGEYGTYFVGYSRRLWVTERMLERMFVGEPRGCHDRLLDFSRPVTGGVFFVPSMSALSRLAAA
ncbi:Dyp-type peroxidase [Agromyces aureus]|uniref:Peroxidase n=1 Tax=Agromyces aureus TaxID=453304 RepID=A0A191WG62_9MICO|nr:Dyp-type peroxidase [Agromyces aureus]ANJ27163.1 peroxidase [Agromyces aureus]